MGKCQSSGSVPESRLTLSLDEAAKTCGLSRRTISDKVRAGELRAARIGARILILTDDLTAWINSHADNSGALVRADLAEGVRRRNARS